MQTLQCSDKILRELISKQVVRLSVHKDIDGNDILKKSLILKSPVTEEVFEFFINEINLSDKETKVLADLNKSYFELSTDNFTNTEWWKLFLSRIPSNIEHGKWTKANNFKERRLLKANKNGESAFKLNIDANDISPKKMLIAYAYDLYCKRISSTDENKLKYMLSLDNWLIDIDRIELLHKEACTDIRFIDLYNIDPVVVEQAIVEKGSYTTLNKDKPTTYDY
jgi:hypothetical protein